MHQDILDDLEKLRDAFISRTGTLPTELHLPKTWKLGVVYQMYMDGQVTEAHLTEWKGMKIVSDAETSTPFMK